MALVTTVTVVVTVFACSDVMTTVVTAVIIGGVWTARDAGGV